MVFEPKFTKVVSSVRKNVGMMQSVVEMKLPGTENDISKVLSLGAKSLITNSDVSGRDVSFMGLVDFQLVYQKEGINALDYSAEFRDKFLADMAIDGEVIITSNVVDVSSSLIGGAIKVTAVVEVVIDEIVSKEINVLYDVEGEDAHSSACELTYSTYVGKAYEKFDVTTDVQLEGATSILMVTPSISLNKVDARDNYLVIDGTLNLDICYQNGDNLSDIASTTRAHNFTWEVALDGINQNSVIQSIIGILYNEMKVTTTVDDGVANIGLYVPITYSGFVFNDSTISVVEDLYLEKNYLSVTCENFETISEGNSISFKDNISGTASIQDTAPFIDEVLGVCTSNLVIASSNVVGDKVCVEGVVSSTVAYFTKDTGEITSVQVEMPFAIEQRVNGDDNSIVTICLENVGARSKRGKEIEVSAELNVYIDMYKKMDRCAITQVVLGEEKKSDDCPLYIYIVKPNQTLWDVAKDINVSQKQILEQNPEVELPLKAGDKLVVYKPNIMKF